MFDADVKVIYIQTNEQRNTFGQSNELSYLTRK